MVLRRSINSSIKLSGFMIGCSCLVLGALLSQNFIPKFGNGSTRTVHADKAWSLNVKLTFKEESDLQLILKEWTKVASYCAENEDFLLHYEVGVSDVNPLEVIILERYKTKEQYLSIHKQGEEFLKFRPKLAEMQKDGKVSIEGFSYKELGYGFTGKYVAN